MLCAVFEVARASSFLVADSCSLVASLPAEGRAIKGPAWEGAEGEVPSWCLIRLR
jgi:hypothetical protein